MAEKAPPSKTAIGVVATAIIATVLSVEGHYVNNKNDPGGETNHGITKVVAVQHGYTGDMKLLSKELATSIYYQDYIVKPGFAPFLELSPAVAEELVDTGVNTGTDRPSRWLQASLNVLSNQGKSYPVVAVDGRVGPGTVNSYRALQKVRGPTQACQLIVKSLDAQQGQYYLTISQNSPALQTFTAGWLLNRVGNVPLSHCG